MDQEEKETGMQTENCREEEEREEGEAIGKNTENFIWKGRGNSVDTKLGFSMPNIPSFLRDVSE